MTATLTRQKQSNNTWEQFCNWVTSTDNRLYVGWLAAGWMTLLGQRIGSNIGSEVGSVFNGC